nr:MAG TPA: hypothetical protein [Bacteriophage sp.]
MIFKHIEKTVRLTCQPTVFFAIYMNKRSVMCKS